MNFFERIIFRLFHNYAWYKSWQAKRSRIANSEDDFDGDTEEYSITPELQARLDRAAELRKQQKRRLESIIDKRNVLWRTRYTKEQEDALSDADWQKVSDEIEEEVKAFINERYPEKG